VKDAAQDVAEDVPQDGTGLGLRDPCGARPPRHDTAAAAFVQLALRCGRNWAAQWHLARAVGKRFRGCRAKRLYVIKTSPRILDTKIPHHHQELRRSWVLSRQRHKDSSEGIMSPTELRGMLRNLPRVEFLLRAGMAPAETAGGGNLMNYLWGGRLRSARGARRARRTDRQGSARSRS